MLKIGLTGGIGCGKTTVAGLFAAHSAPVIDADAIAHQLVEPGQPALLQLRDIFSSDIINRHGHLDRCVLRDLVFSDPEKKQQLEAILHPLIYKEMQRLLTALNSIYAILCIPLLLETGMQGFVDRIAVVDCPENTQLERVKKRGGISESTIRAIIKSQVSRQQRLAAADDIIDNSGTEMKLAQQVETLHNLYLSLRTPERNAPR